MLFNTHCLQTHQEPGLNLAVLFIFLIPALAKCPYFPHSETRVVTQQFWHASVGNKMCGSSTVF